MKNKPTAERVNELFNYDEKTGIITRKIDAGRYGKHKAGSVFGSKGSKGYLTVYIDGYVTKAHRLIWFIFYKKWPDKQIDHINGDRSDNRIKNLREVTNAENLRNMKIHREGHLLGTHFVKSTGKWRSSCRIGNKTKFIGHFNSQLEAHEAYKQYLKSAGVK